MPTQLSTPEITDQIRESAEPEIRETQKPIDFDTQEYPVEFLVYKYIEGKYNDTNEVFIHTYQRQMIWNKTTQSKFI